ncbi:hypothetical protein HYPSUDRAFT_203839 [Hypholoma sublateritium FD-334 SS-4]|uniref:Hydrophobin n=1 Tax=Hypholoma sublateritium (strain FD-334 SS-4) TaxID=945553 RepID=A0A0D2NND7_HYPSF|nr:hypothetical protein HYPSUDRAFT_203839 [Hypholoma sublateritium FD-334 SS-4]
MRRIPTHQKSALLVLAFAAPTATAICSGFTFGIGNLQSIGNGVNSWTVFDNSCNAVDGLITGGNPCVQGIFGCSPAPIIFNVYTSTFSGTKYACRGDPGAETCGGVSISVCCI